jgi:hypothetical protein
MEYGWFTASKPCKSGFEWDKGDVVSDLEPAICNLDVSESGILGYSQV